MDTSPTRPGSIHLRLAGGCLAAAAVLVLAGVALHVSNAVAGVIVMLLLLVGLSILATAGVQRLIRKPSPPVR